MIGLMVMWMLCVLLWWLLIGWVCVGVVWLGIALLWCELLGQKWRFVCFRLNSGDVCEFREIFYEFGFWLNSGFGWWRTQSWSGGHRFESFWYGCVWHDWLGGNVPRSCVGVTGLWMINGEMLVWMWNGMCDDWECDAHLLEYVRMGDDWSAWLGGVTW